MLVRHSKLLITLYQNEPIKLQCKIKGSPLCTLSWECMNDNTRWKWKSHYLLDFVPCPKNGGFSYAIVQASKYYSQFTLNYKFRSLKKKPVYKKSVHCNEQLVQTNKRHAIHNIHYGPSSHHRHHRSRTHVLNKIKEERLCTQSCIVLLQQLRSYLPHHLLLYTVWSTAE